MITAQTDLPILLLDMIAPQRSLDTARIAALGDDEWAAIDAMAIEHRLRPLLHWRFADEPVARHIPAQVRDSWAAAYRGATLRSLALQRNLLALQEMLTGAGIPYLALKGAYLAWYAYPKPGLRPLRDIDLLVPRDRAMDMFDTLLARGYRRTEQYMGDPGAYLEVSHQLPPLRTPSEETVVELHTHLFHRDEKRADMRDPSGDPAYWNRATERTMAGRPIRFPAPEDILIHLIEHAVHGHQFDNGPLLFSDIAFLLSGHAIDWPLFWKLADEAQCRRGVQLGLALVRRYWPDAAIPSFEGPAETVPEDVLNAAARASVRGKSHRQSDHLLVNAQLAESGAQRTAHVWRRLFPDRNAIALIYPVRAESPLVAYYYLKRLWTLATQRLPGVLSVLAGRRPRDTVEGLVLIHRWLGQRG